MTEQEWLTSTDPRRMLDHLLHGAIAFRERPGGLPANRRTRLPCATDRKLRLFACACCRAVWPLLADQRIRLAVEVAEKFADGLETRDELLAAYGGAFEADTEVNGDGELPPSGNLAVRMAYNVAYPGIKAALSPVLRWAEPAVAAEFLRHIVNPWHSVCAWRVVYDGLCRKCKDTGSGGDNFTEGGKRVTCLACRNTGHECVRRPEPWLTPTVTALAAALYDGGDCAHALHDALLEAGAPAEIVEHFRPQPCNACGGRHSAACSGACRGTGWQPQFHPKGCWALDLILGKE